MSLAHLVVTAVRVEGRPVAEVARDYGLGRTWIYELLRRYDHEGEAGLEPRSRRPTSSPTRTPAYVEERIVTLRKQLTDQGLDAGAVTIAWHLQQQDLPAPSVATIWRILSRRGFVTPQPHKRPKASLIRFEADQPNERWQADTTHWPLADGTDIEICNILDDHSRLAIAATARAVYTAASIVEVFDTAFEIYGLPASVLTDNAAIFTGRYRGHGHVALEKRCASLHIHLHHGRVYHPQTQGKVERFHQTVKRWLAAHDPATDLNELQILLDTFIEIYNTARPHRALHRATPAQVFAARPKAQPGPTIGAPHTRIRRDRVNAGVVTLRHNSRLHHIGIGAAHTGSRVLLLVHELDIRVIHAETGELLRALTLDPTRDYQPQGAKPGPKTAAETPPT